MAEHRGLSSLMREDGTASYRNVAVGDGDFSQDLKRGMSVLLHVKVGTLEPASIKLDEESQKLVIKTNRYGWRAMCYCYNRRYELGSGEMEPVPKRAHTRLLTRSISIITGGDAHLIRSTQKRSISLIRRYPTAETIDLTFPTAEDEERLRAWVQQRLVVDHGNAFRRTSEDVHKALVGRSPSDDSDDVTETATTTTEGRLGSDRSRRPSAAVAATKAASKAAPIYPTRGAAIPRRRSSYSQRDVRTKEEYAQGQVAYATSEPSEVGRGGRGDGDDEETVETPPAVLSRMEDPPAVLPRMETPPTVRRLGKGGSRRAPRSQLARLPAASSSFSPSPSPTTSGAAGASAAVTPTSARSLPSLGEEEGVSPSSMTPPSQPPPPPPRQHGRNVAEPMDFWDPLKLLGGESKAVTPVTAAAPSWTSSSVTLESASRHTSSGSYLTPRSTNKARSVRSDNSE